MFSALDVNIERVLRENDALAAIGCLPEGGVTRLTFSGAHQEATNLVASWMEEMNLDVFFDQWGNLFGRHEGRSVQDRVVLTGSHLDSVPNGGNFDGPLGVIGALEAVRMLQTAGVDLKRSIEIVSFIEEEGSRFKMLLGSALAINEIASEEISQIEDSEGIRFVDALESVEFSRPVRRRNLRDEVDSYIELHIEQGKRLENQGRSVGVVTSIAGPKFYEVSLFGKADHAGTTAYEDRKDTLIAAAEIILGIREIATTKFIEDGRLTVGSISALPGVINVVAEQAVFTIDTRAASLKVVQEIEREIRKIVDRVCRKYHLRSEITVLMTSPPAQISSEMQDVICRASKSAALEPLNVVSWAAHDAMDMARITKAGMIFVPSVGGRSHCPEEYTQPEDVAAGIAVLANSLYELANM